MIPRIVTRIYYDHLWTAVWVAACTFGVVIHELVTR